MQYKVSGSLSKPMNLTVLDSDGVLQAKQSFPAGDYEIHEITASSGIVFGTTATDEFEGFGNIYFIYDGTPYQAPNGVVSVSGSALHYTVQAIAWYPNSAGFVIGYNHDVINDTCMALLKRTDNTFNLSHITTNNDSTNGLAFDAQGRYLYSTGGGLGYWRDYFKRENDNYTILAAPSVILPGSSICVSTWNEYVAYGHQIPPWLTIYKRSGDQLNKLVELYNGDMAVVMSSSWSSDGTYLAVGLNVGGSNFQWFKRVGDTFTRLASPASMPSGNVTALAWDSTNTYLACNSSTGQRLFVYKRSGDTLTALPDLPTPPTSASAYAWTFDSKYLAMGTGTSPYLWVYSRSGDTFTKLADPSVPPTSSCSELVFSPNAAYLAMGLSASPYLKIYKCAEELGMSA